MTGTDTEANLVIELSATQCSFLALDVNDNNLLGYSFYSTSFKQDEADYFLAIEEELRALKSKLRSVRKVNLFLDNSNINFIPATYYNAEDALQHFSLQHGNLAPTFLLKETNILYEIIAIFSYNQKLQELITNEVGDCNLYHSFVTQATASFSNLPVTIIFHKFYFNICVKRDGQLQVIKSCSFENEDDVVYQILNVFRLLEIPVESTLVGICGAIDESSVLYKTLNEFLFEIQLLKSDINLSEEIPAHYFYHLLQFNKCV